MTIREPAQAYRRILQITIRAKEIDIFESAYNSSLIQDSLFMTNVPMPQIASVLSNIAFRGPS